MKKMAGGFDADEEDLPSDAEEGEGSEGSGEDAGFFSGEEDL